MTSSEITGMEGDIITMQDIFAFKKRGVRDTGEVLGEFFPREYAPNSQSACLSAAFNFPCRCLTSRRSAERRDDLAKLVHGVSNLRDEFRANS